MRKINYIWPKPYKDKDGHEFYYLPKSGDPMGLGELNEIYDIVKESADRGDKSADMWIQFFDTGYRVSQENYDPSRWSGHLMCDIDSKLYYNHCKKFDTKKLFNDLSNYMKLNHIDNFMFFQLSNSETSYHVIWYFDCERTETNIKKCINLAFKWIREAFMSIGLVEIIDYVYCNHKVLDRCAMSIFQGCYLSKKPAIFGNISNSEFGKIDVDSITLEETIINTFDKGNREYNYEGKEDIDKTNIPHLGHYQRRFAYEALIEIFKTKDKVQKEWEYICDIMPLGNHSIDFYKNEPNKNKWFDRFDSNISHDVNILKKFGYKFKCTTDYIYQRGFNDAWRLYIKNSVYHIYSKSKKYEAKFSEIISSIKSLQGIEKPTKAQTIELESQADDIIKKNMLKLSIFDDEYNNLGKAIEGIDNIDLDEEIEELRSKWKQDRWDYTKYFNYLVFPYDKKDDLTAYKMFADIYYRDKDNNPLLKYNILEDEVLVYSYWYETEKFQWHTFKYNDEYTTWCNKDEYSNKMVKEKMRDAVNKYVTKNFAYHSIKEYLNNLDLSLADEDLLETWAIRLFKADDTKLTRAICKNFFIAAVKKLMVENPTSFVFQHMLLLHGKTGCGKTAFLVKMFTLDGHSYILNKLNPDDPDNVIGPLVAKNWLIQFGEGGKLNKVDVNAAKEFIDRINLGMKYQKKYENEQTTIYPRVVACRTSNDDVLFNDISVDIDRRNWLIECKTPMNSCDEKMRTQMDSMKDIIWATAYKLYLENPDIDLELSDDLFEELGKIQESHRMITQNDIKEIYQEIFERQYITNGKGFIIDEFAFQKMVERSELVLDSSYPNNPTTYVSSMLDEDAFTQRMIIKRIPAKWLSNYVKSKYNNSTMKKLKDYLTENGWVQKVAGYNKKTLMCWIKE